MFESFSLFHNQLAIITEDGLRISYEKLDQLVEAFQSRFSSGQGVALIECENSLNSLVAYLSALRAGCPAILVASQQPTVNETLRAQFSALYYVDTVADTITTYESADKIQLHPDLAVLLSTSGSTGTAKSIRLSHNALEANARSIIEYLAITSEDRAPTTLPMYYSYGLSVINSHLLAGATLVLTQRSVAEPEFWELFDQHHCTSFAGVPHSYALIEKSGMKTSERKTLRYATQAGGRLEPYRVKALAEQSQKEGWKFFVMYGQTEATARMAYLPPDLASEHPNCIGVPIPGGQFRLIDDQGREIQDPDETGELIYTGDNVMMGYALSAEDLARGYDLAELQTGDLARRSSNGLYYIVGRKKRFVKLYGLRISLDEVDGWLVDHGYSAVSTGRDDTLWILTPIADSISIIRDAVGDWLSLPAAAINVAVIETIPRKANGKIDFSEVARLADQAAKKLETETTRRKKVKVRDIFATRFPKQEIDPQSSFISLGGDSLSYVQLAMEFERHLGYLPQGWEHLSIAQLEALTPQKKTFSPTETNTILRAIAIFVVVADHSSLMDFPGGAFLLLMIAGANFARFQSEALVQGRLLQPILSLLRNLVMPYFVIALSYQIWKRDFDLSVLFLFSNFINPEVSSIFPVWFVSVLVQVILLFSLLFTVQPLRRFAKVSPWIFGLFTLLLGIAVKAGIASIWNTAHLYDRLPHMLFWMFSIGWIIQFAHTKRQKAISTGILWALVPILTRLSYAHISYTHAVWMLVGGTLLLWIPTVPIPQLVKSPLQIVGAATYYIYLFHMIGIHVVSNVGHIENPWVNTIAGIFGGIAVWAGVQTVQAFLAHRRSTQAAIDAAPL